MVRKQLYIEENQDRALKRRAKKLGISEAEVVRKALDAALAREGAPPPPPPSLPGDDPLERLLARAEQYAQQGHEVPPERWRREDLYAEREDRWMKRIDAAGNATGAEATAKRRKSA